jgi:hypothetical protein
MTYHTSGWVATHGGLLATLGAQFHTQLSPFDRVDAAVSIVFLASIPLVWRVVGPAYATYAAVGALLPLIHGLAGMERYVIVLFPVFAAWAASDRKPLQYAMFGASLLGLLVAASMFAVGYTLT